MPDLRYFMGITARELKHSLDAHDDRDYGVASLGSESTFAFTYRSFTGAFQDHRILVRRSQAVPQGLSASSRPWSPFRLD